MIKQDANAWDNFIHTGKVEDYLRYCQAKQQSPPDETKEAASAYAAYNGGDRPEAVQGRRG